MRPLIDKTSLTIGDQQVTVYPAAASDRPVVYLNTFAEEGDRVYQELSRTHGPDFTLVVISGLDWNHDMAPWRIPPITKNDVPCTGGADAYLQFFTGTILPKAEALIPGTVPWRGLAGYSLAGLFAVYAMYQTAYFSRIASISGSLWFPAFKQYVFTHDMMKKPDYLYFSLGDKESRTSNPYLKPVEECTEAIRTFYAAQGLHTAFRLNPGGHHKNTVGRTAAGIAWILSK